MPSPLISLLISPPRPGQLRKWYLEEQERIARDGADAARKAAASFERTNFDDESDLLRQRKLQVTAS